MIDSVYLSYLGLVCKDLNIFSFGTHFGHLLSSLKDNSKFLEVSLSARFA